MNSDENNMDEINMDEINMDEINMDENEAKTKQVALTNDSKPKKSKRLMFSWGESALKPKDSPPAPPSSPIVDRRGTQQSMAPLKESELIRKIKILSSLR